MTSESGLPATTELGPLALDAADLPRLVTFYRDILGMNLFHQDEDEALLGAGEKPLLHIYRRANARLRPRSTTGLYHVAYLLPGRSELAALLHRLAARNVPLQGVADHLVSEALYLADPEGNGIELYRDRPRDEWVYVDGTVQIDTLPLDVNELLAAASEPVAALPPGTTVGHVHLQVADLDDAVTFYRDVVGFDLVTRYGPAAAFLSVGGYHHHLGLNTWAGPNAAPPPANSTGLRWYTLTLPDRQALENLLGRARAAGYSPEARGETSYYLPDPAHNMLYLTV